MDNEAIPSVECQKDLGIWTTPSMDHSHQCNVVARTCHRTICCIMRTFQNWNKDIIVHLHKSLIRPRLEFAICAWAPFLERDINILERVQRRITKMVPGLQYVDYETRLMTLGLQTKTRRVRCDLILTFKIIKGLADFPMERLFEYCVDAGIRGHDLTIRSTRLLPRRNFRCHSFSERVM